MGALRDGAPGGAWLGPVRREADRQGSGERESWDELIIPGRLRDAIARINPKLPPSAVDEADDDRHDRRHRATPWPRTTGSTST